MEWAELYPEYNEPLPEPHTLNEYTEPYFIAALNGCSSLTKEAAEQRAREVEVAILESRWRNAFKKYRATNRREAQERIKLNLRRLREREQEDMWQDWAYSPPPPLSSVYYAWRECFASVEVI